MKKLSLVLSAMVLFASVSFAHQTNPDPAKNMPPQSKSGKSTKSDKKASDNKEMKKTDKKASSDKATK